MDTNMNDVTANKPSPGWYVFSLAKNGQAIAGPFSLAKEAANEMKKLEKVPGTCFIAGIEVLNRKQRRMKAKQKRKSVKNEKV